MLKLRSLEQDIIPFQEISMGPKINYENLETISYASTLRSNFRKIDTLVVFNITWDDDISRRNKKKKKKEQEMLTKSSFTQRCIHYKESCKWVTPT